VIRANAWGARHLVDLEAPKNSDADNDQFPGPGAVAFYLWGINPLNPQPAMQWFERQAERVRETEDRELRKDQPRDRLGRFASTAGGGVGAGEGAELPGGPNNPRPGMGDIKISDNVAKDMASGSAGPHLIKNEAGEWEFTPERQAMHDKIVSEAVDGVPRSAEPTYYVMGGGPAAGKSTMLRDGGVNVPQGKQAVQVNADDVKTQIPEYKSMTEIGDMKAAAFSHEESSYIAKRIQAAGMERGTDVVLDGTGDSTASSIGGKIDSAKSQGYKVVGNYATVPTDVAIQRANDRGRKTGRYVPESVIRATHSGVSSVFPQVAGRFDEVNLFDTTGRPKLLARGRKGKIEILDQTGYSAFLAKAGE
ncbi:MAG: zeta toxin family protein, partial [Ilumatobacteraceae bacterium]